MKTQCDRCPLKRKVGHERNATTNHWMKKGCIKNIALEPIFTFVIHLCFCSAFVCAILSQFFFSLWIVNNEIAWTRNDNSFMHSHGHGFKSILHVSFWPYSVSHEQWTQNAQRASVQFRKKQNFLFGPRYGLVAFNIENNIIWFARAGCGYMLVHLSVFFCHLHFYFLSACRPDGTQPSCVWVARAFSMLPVHGRAIVHWKRTRAKWTRTRTPTFHCMRRHITNLQKYYNMELCVCARTRLLERKRIPLIYEIHNNALMFTVCSTFYAQRTRRRKKFIRIYGIRALSRPSLANCVFIRCAKAWYAILWILAICH